MTTQTQKPIDLVLQHFSDVKGPKNDWYTARCPSHNDKNPSLSFRETDNGGVVFKCFAGCSREQILQSLGLEASDVKSGSYKTGAIINTVDLAIDKEIPFLFLDKLGLTDGSLPFHKKDGTPYTRKGVVIPYHMQDGTPYERQRLRTALTAKEGSYWSEGDAPIIPYGLERLENARKAGYIVIVEGESDSWTLWYHDIPALGIPCVGMYASLKKEYVENIEKLYIIQEPPSQEDIEKGRDPGKKFVADVHEQLQKIGYTGKIYSIDFQAETGTKDPNALRKKDAKAFDKTIETVLNRARPMFEVGKNVPATLPFSAQSLMSEVLPEARFAIPDLVPEGVSLFCGKGKIGKSWLVLASAIAIASGGYALGKIKVEQGEVLYLALEDNKRRLQSRLGQLLHAIHSPIPDGLYFETSWPRLDNGGLEKLEQWIQEHQKTRLIIIDT